MSAPRGVVAFDIDGTLEIGEPPGPVTLEMVRRARALGYLVGSCSDRPAGWQRMTWERFDLVPDFTVLAHQLERVRDQFEAAEYVHVSAGARGAHYASLAGFAFVAAGESAGQPWSVDAQGAVLAPYTGSLSVSERARLDASAP